jgi:hypothetical protein
MKGYIITKPRFLSITLFDGNIYTLDCNSFHFTIRNREGNLLESGFKNLFTIKRGSNGNNET